jgi:penicillin-binding protein 1A
MLFQRLPSVDGLEHYRPSVPLRIYTDEGTLIGEFGEEHRTVVQIGQVPAIVKRAVLAAEDEHFFEHGGVDYPSIVRAAVANLRAHGTHEGASTITMQLARNFYLTNQKLLTRKAAEALLALKIEQALSKDHILELYVNQIYLGERSYGFAAAADVYFGKPLEQLTVAQAAMLAGLPKAPSAFDPFVNPQRALERRAYVLRRLHEIGAIDDQAWQKAAGEPLALKSRRRTYAIEASYAAEEVRQMLFDQFGDDTYRAGFVVRTTLRDAEQRAAVKAVRSGVLAYDARHGYRGPERRLACPPGADALRQCAIAALGSETADGGLAAAVVTEADPRGVTAITRSAATARLGLPQLRLALGARPKTLAIKDLPPGSLIRLARGEDGHWELAQLPRVEAALVAIAPRPAPWPLCPVASISTATDTTMPRRRSASPAPRSSRSCTRPHLKTGSRLPR